MRNREEERERVSDRDFLPLTGLSSVDAHRRHIYIAGNIIATSALTENLPR